MNSSISYNCLSITLHSNNFLPPFSPIIFSFTHPSINSVKATPQKSDRTYTTCQSLHIMILRTMHSWQRNPPTSGAHNSARHKEYPQQGNPSLFPCRYRNFVCIPPNTKEWKRRASIKIPSPITSVGITYSSIPNTEYWRWTLLRKSYGRATSVKVTVRQLASIR